MKLLLIALSLFSISALACEDVKLKDSVDSCYRVHSNGFVSNTGVSHKGQTKYALELECVETTYVHGDNAKDRMLLGEYAIPNQKVKKKVDRKKFYRTLSYCQNVAQHIEEKGEYPGVLDQMDYFGEAYGLGPNKSPSKSKSETKIEYGNTPGALKQRGEWHN